MTRRVTSILISGLLLAAAISSSSSAAEPANSGVDAKSLELLITDVDRPIRLELRVEIDGQPLAAIWRETFTQLLSYLDRDDDGTLDRTEAARVPSAFTVRQVLWGRFSLWAEEPSRVKDLDLNVDSKVSGEELAAYYHRAGLGGVLVGVGRSNATTRLTDAILEQLDTNNDGAVDEAEWKAAAEVLPKLDSNSDELIGPGELVAHTTYPGALGTILLKAPAPDVTMAPIADALPLIVLPLCSADLHWTKVVTARRKTANLPEILPDTLRTAAPSAVWQVRLTRKMKDEAMLQEVGGKLSATAMLSSAAGKVRLDLRGDEGNLTKQTAAARNHCCAVFAEADVNSDGTVDQQEIARPKAGQLKQLAMIADRDGDGTLCEKEFEAWLRLQGQLAKGHVLLTIVDHGNGLFELLDSDHDGALSLRELRAAWERWQSVNGDTQSNAYRSRLPRQLLATISHGHPQTNIGKSVHSGPAWFLAMDRNGDGDVSIKEWVYDLAKFRQLDQDQDGLLNADEAR